MALVDHAPTLMTAAAGSGAAVVTEVLPDGFFQAITQLFIACVTVWKILSDNRKNGNAKDKSNPNQ
jgi:hypothetical protein